MLKAYEYSYFGGSEVLALRHPAVAADIDTVIAGVSPPARTAFGRRRYSARDITRAFRDEFHFRGYRPLSDTYSIEVPGCRAPIEGEFEPAHLSKDGVLLEVQFGKYAAMFYDMAKFQYFFNENRADVGVEIVPCVHLRRQMSSGVSYGEQLIFDIERLKRHFPAVPVKVILIGMDVNIEVAGGPVAAPEED